MTLGLYPVWYKRVGVLSTGEIRKVLLAYVLSKSPRVVVRPFVPAVSSPLHLILQHPLSHGPTVLRN